MATSKLSVSTKVATLALPTREAHIAATVWPGPQGMLLFLAEFNLAPQTRQEFLQKINAEIERIWQEVKLLPGPADEILEAIVVPVNKVLMDNQRLLGNPLSPRYQMLLSFISGQKIALADLGLIDAYVINQQKLNNILVTSSRRQRKQGATFDNLISGELSPGENLLLATPALTDYFSWERLKQLVADRAPGLALREIEKYMLQLKTHPPLGLICLKISLADSLETTDASMNHLLNTKAQTSSLLQPKLFGYLKNKLTKAKTPPATDLTYQVAETDANKPIPKTISKTASNSTLFFGKIRRFLNNLIWLRNRESIKSTIAWWLEVKINQWRQLNSVKRATLLLGLIILLAFSQSIVNIGRNKNKAADSEFYNKLVTDITEKQAAIEGALIYGDHDKALVLFNEAKNQLEQLPHNTASRQEQLTALRANLSLLARRLQYLNEVTEPTVWSQLPPPAANQSWSQLAFLSGEIMALANNKLIGLAVDGKPSESITLPTEISSPKKTISLGNDLVIINQDNKAGLYQNKKVTLLNQNLELQDGSTYQSGIYYLSQNNRTIWRTSIQGDNLTTPTRWLRTSEGELSESIGLAVDGSIFVASANSVAKYNRGLKQDFTLAQVNPPLRSVTYIYTSTETDYLYLWEKTNKRLVVYDKAGKLIIQVTLPTLANIVSIAIDGPNKILYALSDNTIYRVPILETIK